MAETTDFTDLLTSATIAKIRPFIEDKKADLERFVSAFIKSMPGGQNQIANPARKEENIVLIRRLIELFQRMDTYGTGEITWDQFTSFAAENTLSEDNSGRRGRASVLYREQRAALSVPPDQDLPATKVICMKWVPELQQLFVTYQNYPTVFVFNHLCRMIARLHANMPPSGSAPPPTLMLTDKAKKEVIESYRDKMNLRQAMETATLDTEKWVQGQLGDTRGGAEEEDEDEEDVAARQRKRDAKAAKQEEELSHKSQKQLDHEATIAWAQRILSARINTAPGERMKAAAILANARSTAEARKNALRTELGAGLSRNSASLTLMQQRQVESEIAKTLKSGKYALMRPQTADAALAAARNRTKPLFDPKIGQKVAEVVKDREIEATFKRNYALERATAQSVLLSHPAGFALSQADRLKNMSVADLGEAADAVLPMLGVKNASTAHWDRARKLLKAAMRSGPSALVGLPEGGAAAAGGKEVKKDTRTVAEATGGKPQAASSAAVIAFDPGPNAKIYDFGYPIDKLAKFGRQKREGTFADGGSSAVAAADPLDDGRVKARTRLDLLALPRGRESADVTFLGVEYCMPVDRKFAEDVRAWRQIKPTDVKHLLAVSSSDLVITLWNTRTLTYAGVIHVLLPQDRLAWSSGANTLFSCNSIAGPVTGWDVLTGSKVAALDAHSNAVMAILDVPSQGIICVGSLDATISVWSYRNEADSVGSELAGLRGRAPPHAARLDEKMEGHSSGVILMKAIDDPLQGKLISSALGSEICLWDLGHRSLLAKVGTPARDTAINALALTCTNPPYALSIDEGNTLRMWSIGGSSVLEQLDSFRFSDLPFSGVGHLVVPNPSPHVIMGGHHITLLAPTNPSDSGGEQVLALPGATSASSSANAAPPVACVYSAELGVFLVAEGMHVSIWDARTGQLKRSLKNMMPELIVSMTLDGTGRKFLLGDAGGELLIANVLDGRILQRAVNGHTDDVTKIIVVPEDQIPVTCSWDRSIRAWDMSRDNGSTKQELVPVCRLIENSHGADITAMAVSRGLGLVATGAADGTLRLWDFCTFELVAQLSGHTNGITSLAFPGPAVMPLLVSSDDGGFMHLWAVRGSNYSDRLIMALRNLGRAGGPPPPNLKTVDLSALRAESKRRRVTTVKDGIVSVNQVSVLNDATLQDEQMKSFFAAKQKESASASRQSAMMNVLQHTAAQEKGAEQDAAELRRTLGRRGSAIEKVGGEKLGKAIHQPAARPGSAKGASTGSRLVSEDSVPVPISALRVVCKPMNPRGTSTGQESESKDIDCATPVVFKIFTGDGQGMVKQWDVSVHINRFCRGGRTGLGIVPPSRLAYSTSGWQPRSAKHRVYPIEGPAAYDPHVEAQKANLRAVLKHTSRLGPGAGRGGKGQESTLVSSDAARMQSVLATLRTRRTLYSTANPVKPIQKVTVKVGSYVPSLNQLEAQLNHEDAQRAAAQAVTEASADAARIAQAGTELRKEIKRMAKRADKEKEQKEEEDAVLKKQGSWNDSEYSALGFHRGKEASSEHGSVITSAPPAKAARPASAHGKTVHGTAETIQSSISTVAPPHARLAASPPPPSSSSNAPGAQASSPGSPVDPAPSAPLMPAAVTYPKVKPLLGTVLYERFHYNSKPVPLLPALVRPSADLARAVSMGGDGMEMEDDGDYYHDKAVAQARAAGKLTAVPTGLSMAEALGASTALPDAAAAERDAKELRSPRTASQFNAMRKTSDLATPVPSLPLVYEELSQEVQDELWYTFTSEDPDYVQRKNHVRKMAEAEAQARHWEAKEDVEGPSSAAFSPLYTTVHPHGDPWSGHTPSKERSPRSPAAASTPSNSAAVKLGIGRKGSPERATFKVPEEAWVASRLRLDIRPVAKWTGHTDMVTSLTFIADPVALATTSMDGSTRLWTPNGLPLGVVNAPPRNLELERAMEAASRMSKTARGPGQGGGAEDPFALHTAVNLSKHECPWQFAPNDEEKMERTTKAATTMLSRITTFRANRRASIQLTAAIKLNVQQVAATASSANIDSVLQSVYAKTRRASLAAAAEEASSNKLLLAAKAATLAAEAVAERASTVRGMTRTSRPATVRDETELNAPATEEAARALDKALIAAINQWEDGAEGGSTARKVSAEPVFTAHVPGFAPPKVHLDFNPNHIPGVPGSGTAPMDEDMLRRYGHMAVEVHRKAAEAKDDDLPYKGLPVKDMRELGLLPPSESQQVKQALRSGAKIGPNGELVVPVTPTPPPVPAPSVRPSTASSSTRPGSASRARPGTSAGPRPSSAARAAGRPSSSSGAHRPSVLSPSSGSLGGSGYGGPVKAMPLALEAPAATPDALAPAPAPVVPTLSLHSLPSPHGSGRGKGGMAAVQAAQAEMEARLAREALVASDTAAATARTGASDGAEAEGSASPPRPSSTRPSSADGRRPGSAGRAPGRSSLTAAVQANIQGMVSKLRVSTAAAAAGYDLECKLGVGEPGAGEGEAAVMAVANVRMFLSRPPTRSGTADPHGDAYQAAPGTAGSDPSNLQDFVDVPEAVLAATPAERLASTLSRTRDLLSQPVSSTPLVTPALRARVDDVIAAAEMITKAKAEASPDKSTSAGAAARRASFTGKGVSVRPGSAMPRLGGGAGPVSTLDHLLHASATLRSMQLEDIPATDVFGSGSGAAGVLGHSGLFRPGSASTGGRPGSAARAGRGGGGAEEKEDRPASPWRVSSASTSRPPSGLPKWDALLWPYREYLPPRSFGVYTRSQVDKFRVTWAALDSDGSGQVDIEELLNAKVFSASTLKVTKALFATIDEDKSGTVSLKEMLRVAFPLADGDGRVAISKYLHFVAAREKARTLKEKAAFEDLVHGGEHSNEEALRATLAHARAGHSSTSGGGGAYGSEPALGLEPVDEKGRPKAPPKGKAGDALAALARSRESRQAVKGVRQSGGGGGEEEEPAIYL